MEQGTKVEIRKIWAYETCPKWFSGYVYIRPVNDKASLVECQRGIFAGVPICVLNVDIRALDIRALDKS